MKPADRLGRKSSDRCGFFFLYGSFDLLKRRFFYLIEGYIHSIESMGLVDGPGIRTVVFFQGCRLRCRYCHNPDTWAMNSGKEQIVTPEQLVKRILRFKPYFGDNGGVTFSGGEPLLQKESIPASTPPAAAAAVMRRSCPIPTSFCWTSSTSRRTVTAALPDSLPRSSWSFSPPCRRPVPPSGSAMWWYQG